MLSVISYWCLVRPSIMCRCRHSFIFSTYKLDYQVSVQAPIQPFDLQRALTSLSHKSKQCWPAITTCHFIIIIMRPIGPISNAFMLSFVGTNVHHSPYSARHARFPGLTLSLQVSHWDCHFVRDHLRIKLCGGNGHFGSFEVAQYSTSIWFKRIAQSWIVLPTISHVLSTAI